MTKVKILTLHRNIQVYERKTGHNSTYKKLAIQWLNEALCFV
jgi:hypothetical protein